MILPAISMHCDYPRCDAEVVLCGTENARALRRKAEQAGWQTRWAADRCPEHRIESKT